MLPRNNILVSIILSLSLINDSEACFGSASRGLIRGGIRAFPKEGILHGLGDVAQTTATKGDDLLDVADDVGKGILMTDLNSNNQLAKSTVNKVSFFNFLKAAVKKMEVGLFIFIFLLFRKYNSVILWKRFRSLEKVGKRKLQNNWRRLM